VKLAGSSSRQLRIGAETVHNTPHGQKLKHWLPYACAVDELTSIARAAGRGDRDALAQFVRQTQGDVWRFFAHLVDPAAADDLAQETYLRAIPALRRFRGDAPVRAWLLTIARRACAAEIDARSKNRELSARLAAESAAGPAWVPEPYAQASVGLLLTALDPDRRAAFVLTQLIGCSYAEAAAVCDCPVGTIRSRVARARADLDAMMTEPAAPREANGGGGTPTFRSACSPPLKP
jgi:RNA polymerase sigma-70 factor (ECF subfamily)